MSLTDAQRFDVRFRLGWSERFFQTDSRLEQAMNALATRPDAESKVIVLLGKCATQDGLIEAAFSRLKASEVGSIKLNPTEIRSLERQGARFVNQIAAILGVETRHNIYGSSPAQSFAGSDGPYGGGNFVGK